MDAALSARDSAVSSPRRSRYRVKLRARMASATVVAVYMVIARSAEEAYYTALRFEPSSTRRLMRLDECDFVERVSSGLTGVESVLARFSAPAAA